MKEWQLQEAKSKLSEVIHLAMTESPQLITKRGEPAVYVVDAEAYEREHRKSWKELLLSRPHKEIELDLDRLQDEPRDIDL